MQVGCTALCAVNCDAATLAAALTEQCVTDINAWREEVKADAKGYTAITDNTGATARRDLPSFFSQNKTCAEIKAGDFEHIIGQNNDTKIFVFSASMPAASRTEKKCQGAIKQWESGFEAFNGQYPPKFNDDTSDVYKKNPNAVGLVALLHEDAQKIACGRPKNCTGAIVCYIKPSGITKDKHPVTPPMWHSADVYFKTKPALEMHKEDHKDCLKAVNAVRTAAGLDLDPFTERKEPNAVVTKTQSQPSATEYENFLYELTCEDIESSEIYPAAADGYTIIYAVKEGGTAPTPAEAVKHWESGFEKLNYTIPPVFKGRSDSPVGATTNLKESADEASRIYDDSSVAGYVSLMVDGSRQLHCYNATGCKKAAMVCVLNAATLVNDQQPISDETWTKILKKKGVTKPTFAAREAKENCLEEINAVRTQESLGLSAFVAATEAEKSGSAISVSNLMSGVTCETLKAASVKAADSKTSLMYHSGSEGTCAEAVEAWKKGFEKFTEIPPAYNATETIYQDGAATNFVSLMSDGETTRATCYTASGCPEKAVVCELSPAALTDGKNPISQTNWEKVSETMKANGSTAEFSTAALLISAILAVVTGALQL